MAARERNWSQRSLQFQDVSTVSQEQMNQKTQQNFSESALQSCQNLPTSIAFHTSTPDRVPVIAHVPSEGQAAKWNQRSEPLRPQMSNGWVRQKPILLITPGLESDLFEGKRYNKATGVHISWWSRDSSAILPSSGCSICINRKIILKPWQSQNSVGPPEWRLGKRALQVVMIITDEQRLMWRVKVLDVLLSEKKEAKQSYSNFNMTVDSHISPMFRPCFSPVFVLDEFHRYKIYQETSTWPGLEIGEWDGIECPWT